LGEIKWWFHCIDIARVFSEINDWVLVFHGCYDWEYLEELRSVIRDEHIDNVIVSTEVVDSIDDLDKLIMSCDAGIAWYSDFSVGLRNVGRSSGKISAYLRFGLPVITNSYPTLVSAVQETGCGVCIDSLELIPGALAKIEKNYSEYTRNAIAEYDNSYWFEKYKEGLLDFLAAGKEFVCGIR
jgi:glycosyltransferase involved in cell wall biosynthesis